MSFFLSSILAAVVISVLSLSGVVTLAWRRGSINKILLPLISFSAGTMLGGAFFHLLPEAIVERNGIQGVFELALAGFILFFLLERILRWHHCHDGECQTHKHLGFLNLFGDGCHNFIDGLILVSAFSVGPELGLAVAFSIALHEIPQEIGDFGVLLYAGFSRFKAIIYNLLSALAAISGVIIGFLLLEKIEDLNTFLLPFAAGGFIYIAASDLIPELHKEVRVIKSILVFVFFLAALIFMRLIKA